MVKTDFFWMSANEIGQGYRTRAFSPVELARAFLDRIDAVNGEMKAYITITHDTAMEAARQAEKELGDGQDRGPLHGIPVAVKDLMDTRGIRTTYGSELFADHVPEEDATVVQRLREGGAVILGKTNTDPFAFGVTTENPFFGTPRNPWHPEHVPGGSSGGSGVAVGAGLATVALGSDTAGSVRIPAACCGIVGLKPTAGRVSRYGVRPLSWSLDHVGPIGRSAGDTAALLQVISGSDPRDPATLEQPPFSEWRPIGFQGIRVGVPKNWFFDDIDPEIHDIVLGAIDRIKSLGATEVPIEIPNTDKYFYVFSSIGRAEAVYAHEPFRSHIQKYVEGFRAFLEDGRGIDTLRYIDACRERERIRGALVHVFDSVDVLVSPTMPMEPPRLNQAEFRIGSHTEDVHNALMRIMYPYNLSGHPAITVPCGKTAPGLPVGLQMAARHGNDHQLLGLAETWLKAHPFENRGLHPL